MPNARSRHHIADACLSHMVRRLQKTTPVTLPYPHFWTENIFPEEIFDRLVNELPDTSLYTHGDDQGKHYRNRADLHLLSQTLEQLPDASKELWYGVRSALGAPDLKRAIFDILAAGFAHRFRIDPQDVPEIAAYPRPMLYQEREGYSIAPHPDTRRKLATVQFALAKDASQTDLGTSLYRLSANPKHLLQSPRGFCEVSRYPFDRNSVFAFAVVNTMSMRSWHGREPLPAGCGIRNSLLQIYYADPADANPEVVQEITENLKAA